jgi:cell division protein FtsW
MKNLVGDIKGDKVIWVVVLFLSLFSLLAVYSSTGTLAYKYQGGNTEYYMLKHLIFLFFGLLLIYVFHMIRYIYFSKVFKYLLWFAIPLLLFTLFFGLNLNSAKRVLAIPLTNMTFQTSDFAKLTLIVYLAFLLTKKQDYIKDFRSAFVPIMLPVLLVVFLILPANFSTAAMIFATSIVLMYVGRVNLKYIFSMIGIGIVALSLFLLVLMQMPVDKQGRLGTWKARIEGYINGDGDNFQVEQAEIAIAGGGFFGKMPGNSTQRNFLPHPYSDFIFAIIVEEYGLLGGSFMVLLYLIILFRAVVIVTKIPQTFGAFLSIGVAFSLAFQAMVNMGVAVGLLPVTGQPLPLVSMGGTSIWFTSISLGILLSVSKEIAIKENLQTIQNETAVADSH